MNYKKNVIKIISYLWIIGAFVFCITNHLFEFRIGKQFFINSYVLIELIVITIIPVSILVGMKIKEELDKVQQENYIKLVTGIAMTIISLISFILISKSYYEWIRGEEGITIHGINLMIVMFVTVFSIGIILIQSSKEKTNRKLEPLIFKEKEQAKYEQEQASWYGVDKLKNYCQMETYHSQLSKTVISNVISKEEIFRNLQIIETNLGISKTGAREITVKVKNNTIYHIDGSIKAIFYDENNKKVGFANLVLPALGMVDECILKGICINTDINQEYVVKLEVNNLWIIEYLPRIDDKNLIEVLNKLKSKKISLLWDKIRDNKSLKDIISKDKNIYYDNIVDTANVKYSNDLIKIFKNLEVLDLDEDYNMKTAIADALDISEVNFSIAYYELKKYGAIKIENEFIKVVKSDVEMTEEDFYDLKRKIKSMSYEKLAKSNEKMKKLHDKTCLKYKPGKRKYDLIRFNYIGKKIQLSDKYGEPNNNGVYEINQKASLVNYLNKNITDSDSLYFFLERIKSNGIGVTLAPEVVKLRKEILKGTMSPEDEQSKINEIMMKFKFKEI
ncbi:hypothetical protein [Terrisporobacter vanillatitrophus]|uniref:hypothetical protein n=1 Tax=Terrisporobacter vanillatitrophus TaxID=3058402 RepID=UPI003365F03D